MSLQDLKDQKSRYSSNLESEQSNLEYYRAKADALDDIYQRLKEKKKLMKAQKKTMNTFANENYETFKGNTYLNRYQNDLKSELVDNQYNNIITIIDENLDTINNERTRYENLCYNSKGIIGKLESSINSLVTQIENWVN